MARLLAHLRWLVAMALLAATPAGLGGKPEPGDPGGHVPAACGDLNADGKITMADCLHTLAMVVELRPPATAADIAPTAHPDGRVTVLDALQLLRFVLGLAGPPVACGPPAPTTTSTTPSTSTTSTTRPPLEENLARLQEKIHTLIWLAYAPTHFDPNLGCPAGFPAEVSIRADLETAYAHGFTGLVTYAADCTLAAIPRIAREVGFEGVIMGLFLASETLRVEEMANAKAAAAYSDGYGVGNEGLIGCEGDLYGADRLLQTMADLRAATHKPVTTSEQIDDYLGGCLDGFLLAHGDWIFPIAHPFNSGIRDPAAGVQWTENAFADLAKLTAKTVFLKETGWPTGGEPAASQENQQAYFGLLKGGAARYSHFEGFDQPWKPTRPLPWEPFWGLFRSDRTPKLFIRSSAP